MEESGNWNMIIGMHLGKEKENRTHNKPVLEPTCINFVQAEHSTAVNCLDHYRPLVVSE